MPYPCSYHHSHNTACHHPASISLLRLPGRCRFTSETGLVDLMDLAADQQGGLRLNKAFPAVAKRCAALGRVEGAAALLAFADEGRTEAAGGRGVLQPCKLPYPDRPSTVPPPALLQAAAQMARSWRKLCARRCAALLEPLFSLALPRGGRRCCAPPFASTVGLLWRCCWFLHAFINQQAACCSCCCSAVHAQQTCHACLPRCFLAMQLAESTQPACWLRCMGCPSASHGHAWRLPLHW